MAHLRSWKYGLTGAIVLLWGLQILWLAWHFGPEGRDLVLRVAAGRTGAAIRREDPFFRWLQVLSGVIPKGATYLFLDDYEAGKDIEARYHLAGRRHILFAPDAPPSFLFYAARQEQAAFLIVRTGSRDHRLGPGVRAAQDSPAFHPLILPGPGLVLRVDPSRLLGGFYD